MKRLKRIPKFASEDQERMVKILLAENVAEVRRQYKRQMPAA